MRIYHRFGLHNSNSLGYHNSNCLNQTYEYIIVGVGMLLIN